MLSQDIRYALRTMRRNRAFTAIAVLSLALGIGANTAIFSLIETVMLRPLPVRSPGELIEPLNLYPGDPRLNNFSSDTYEFLRDHNGSLAGLIASSLSPLSVMGDTADGELVSGNYFSLLGLKPATGRLIGPGDDTAQPASSVAAVVSWSYWKGRFGFDPAIVGKRITIQDAPAIIIGVAPQGFSGIVSEYRTQVWVALAAQQAINHTAGRPGVELMGRLRPGVSIGQADAELAVLYRQSIDPATLRRDPNWGRVKFQLEHAAAGLSREVPPNARVRDQFSQPLVFLMAVVALLLLIACTNLASLLLARGAARQREMALRVSLGAGRWRLVRQMLTESLLLSAAGGLGGLGVASLGAGALVHIMASGRGHVELAVRTDWRVLLFTAGAAVLAGLLFGLAPALRAMAAQPAVSLRAGGKGSDTRSAQLFGKGLVTAQVVMGLVLLSGAGLCLAHLSDLRNVNLGFNRDHLLLVNLNPARSGYEGERLASGYRELLGRLEAIPGVRSATLSSGTPISGGAASRFASAEGYTPKAVETRVAVRWIAPRFFETYGTPLVAGRELSFQDQVSAHVAILSQSMARYYFGAVNPLGRHVTLERDDQPFEVVGVVGDSKYLDLYQAPPRTIFLPAFRQGSVNSHSFTIRTSGDPAAVGDSVRRVVQQVLKGVPVQNMTTMEAQMDASIVPERLIATVSTLFGALASLLAAIGVYGLLAYAMARRTSEIGVRMALGATGRDIVRLVLVDAFGMVAAGLLLGIPLSIWVARLAASLMAGFKAGSAGPVAWAGAAMIGVALLAAYLPARRAAKVDPMVALRYE